MQQFHKHSIHILISLFLLLIALAIISRWNTANATEPVETIVVGEEIEWTHYDEFNRIYNQTATIDIQTLHSKICNTRKDSPLCEDIEILKRIDTIAKSKGVPTGLIIWIMNAESSLSTHFNKEACKTRNNPYWIKGRKYDNGKTEWYHNKRWPDPDGCYLYAFDSIDEATYSLANTISIWYKGCNNDVVCLSYKYVGDPEKSEISWVNRVSKFLN